jgi:hypothetical protein
MKQQNVLSAYCFLAALTENNNDLYNHVYVPMCKRALSEYSSKGHEFGTHLDIKEIILEMYGINVPESIVCKLIRGSEASLSRRKKEEIKLQVLENGRSFQLQKWAFTEYDEKFNKSQREANAIEEAFADFIKSKRSHSEKIPCFSEFLNRYKTKLSAFFSGEQKIIERNSEETFYYHVEFLEQIQRSHNTFYKIAQDLYLGAIVAGFLESGFDLSPRKPTNELFFFDTPLVLRALDLQRPEETNPISELIHLIKATGSTPKVLSITVEEIQRVINNAIEHYNNKTSVTTINDACLRRNKDKAWLMTINTNLAKYITDNLKIDIEPVDNDFIKNNEKSSDIPELQELRLCKGNAAHDVYAYLFVRKLRIVPVSIISNAKVWFVTTNPSLLEFNIKKRLADSVPEIVLPDMLTSLLWLKDPAKLVNEIKSTGLKELMASTLTEEVASKELIHEYNKQIKKIDGIDDDAYNVLLEAVAHYSANSIEKFIELAETDSVKARERALQIVEDERSRKAELQQMVVDALNSEERENNAKEKFSQDLDRIEKQLNEANEASNIAIEELKKKVADQDSKLKMQDEKLEKQDTDIHSLRIHLRKQSKKIIFGFVALILFILTVVFISKLGNWSWLIGIISGSGWLWSFGSFFLNALKISKESKS